MVQCDSCKRWFHFSCVKVTQEIQDVSWFCASCATLSSKQPTAPPVVDRDQTATNPPPSQRSRSIGRSSQSESRRRLKLQLLKIEEEKKLEQRYLEKKFEALLEYGSDTSTVISETEANRTEKIEQWVADTERCGEDADSGLEPEEIGGPVPSNLRGPSEHQAQHFGRSISQPAHPQDYPAPSGFRSSQPAHHRIITNHPSLIEPRSFVPGQGSTPMRQSHQVPTFPSMPHIDDETVCILNRSQLAARQAVSKDLPEFSGNPEDWPLFFSVFTNSTQMCGYSNEENMLRLRKCLKGRALEAVKCRLLHPSNVGGVLSTLKMLYGRPEAIVQAIVKKVRALPSPNIDRLETVVNFALTVENLVATIQACEVHDFVYNASLRYELVERLPSTLKLDWAKHSRNKPNPNLLDFSSWLYSTAEDASAVMASVSGDSRPRSSKKDGFLNVHSETESSCNRLYTASSKAKATASSESEKQCPILQAYAFIDDGSELSLMDQSLAEELGLKGPRKSLCLKWTGETQRLENASQLTLLYSVIQEKYQHLARLPIESYENACPRILIGLDNLSLGHPLKCRERQPQEPIAVKTRLGWTICKCNKYSDEDLHQAVKNYFALDSIGIVKPDRLLQSQGDQRAQMLLETLTKARNGRYESGLLWKYDNVRLPDSKPMALKRWECLDRRMKHDPLLAEAVKAKIEDHITKGYIRKLTDEEVQAKYPRVWYLPMFPVVNPNKPGKTRLVWDAAATAHGVSLNSVLLKGPDLLTSLPSVLTQFREFRTAVCGDIREMYQQVLMREDDQPYQLFFYADNGENPSTYVIQVMTFGAPELLPEYCTDYPAAVEVIVKRHYVDDMLLSVEQEEEAIKLTGDVKKIHALAGFEIRNWASNSRAVLEALNESATTEKNLGGEHTVEKILGMWWNTTSDHFTFKISNPEDNDIQLHTFVDASETGFAAVVYLRFQEATIIECALVGSKTRVSPLKFLSIPRSELQAAIIGVRLADTIGHSLSIKVKQRFFWTDSKDVLCWLNSDHRRYSQFVAFRVSEILETSDVREWNWVPSKQNVADEGTKWKNNPDLSASSRWFSGPEFLWKPSDQWPTTNHRTGNTTEELRPHLLLHAEVANPVIDLHRFSNWQKMLRCTAYVLRYVRNLKISVYQMERINGPLQRRELSDAECYLFRTAQNAVYADEITILSRNRHTENPDSSIPRSSPLFHQCAFLDEHNILRVRGRTQACPLIARDAAQPIILPREHPITQLILLDFHKRFNHQNHATTLNEVRQRYRVPRLKATYRTVRKECQECKNDRASPQPPAMSDLPPYRLAAFTRPFTYMGVDYFGPITVIVGRRSEKRWGVLATCLTTRAIHLELAHTLTTDSCILVIRNIMARRGTPAVIFSDRGTNFQGASKELRTVMQNIDQEQLMQEFTTPNTEWTFIPPASPHMGGAWERLIRSVKSNLYKLPWTRLPTDEILYSTLLEIENVINSRPLTDIRMEDDESPVLTPNHFLLGSSNGMKSWVPYNNSPNVLRHNWKLSQAMVNEFWRRWLRDYLPFITRRTKWFMKVKPIHVNDVVVIVDPKAPRNSWPLGRVIATRPGQDGQVRSATVQTDHGIYERPAVKLAVLDVGVRDQYASGGPSAHSGGECYYAYRFGEPLDFL
ncbi:uncharacterized protein LOC135711035 [Ochlerotatus camptorhynchus]|uniref:uncharacterized protein LOC135711035 n=1 Tax=Ochlerotatus camptorhynchus TaxID=644619 RepID=UPI0031E17B8E